MTLKGRIVEDCKNLQRRMASFPDVFKKATGQELFPGTMNVRVDRQTKINVEMLPFRLSRHAFRASDIRCRASARMLAGARLRRFEGAADGSHCAGETLKSGDRLSRR